MIFSLQTHPTIYSEYLKRKKEAEQIRKSQSKSTSSNTAIREKRLKVQQAKLNFPKIQPLTDKEQKKIDSLVLNYIISEARPLQTVESITFQAMVNGLNPHAKIMGVKKLKKLIQCKIESFHTDLIKKLDSVKHVCLAIDMWSTLKRSFMGVTCHWIDETTYERRSAALACKRFKCW